MKNKENIIDQLITEYFTRLNEKEEVELEERAKAFQERIRKVLIEKGLINDNQES